MGEPAGSHDSAEWQIWAYSTAAPDFIGDFATVKGSKGEVLREGSNGWVCLAFNPMPEEDLTPRMMLILLVEMLHHWLGLMLI